MSDIPDEKVPVPASDDRYVSPGAPLPPQMLAPVTARPSGLQSLNDFLKSDLARNLLIVMLCGAVGYLAFVKKPQDAKPMAEPFAREPVKQDPHPEAVQAVQTELERGNDALKKERASLERSRDQLQKERANLQEQIDGLKKQIKELTSQSEVLHATLRATAVLLHARSDAVAVQLTSPKQFVVLAHATGDTAALLDGAAYKHGIVRIPLEQRLTHELISRAGEGGKLPDELSHRVSELFLEEPLRKAKTDEQVVFYDLRRHAYTVGMYDSHDEHNLYYQGFDAGLTEVPIERIQAGSAVRGRAKDVFEVTGNVGFFDYSVVSIVNALSSSIEGSEAPYVALAVHANVEMPSFAQDLQRIQGYLANAESAEIGLGGIRFNPGQAWLMTQGMKYAQHDEQRNRLSLFAMEIEDFFVARLSRGRFSVLERQQLQTILDERKLAKKLSFDGSPRSYGELACATHVVLIDISPSTQGSQYRLAVRLVDAQTGKIVWSDISEEPIAPKIPAEKYLLSSGRLAFIDKQIAPLRGKLQRELLIAAPGAEEAPFVTERVAFIETPTNSDQEVAIRDLFKREVHFIAREKIDKTKCGLIKSIDDVPPSNRMRYLAWSIVDSAAPSSGRVISVGENIADISIRRAEQFLKPGDTLRAARLETTSVAQSLPNGDRQYDVYERPLPFQLTVQQLGESGARAQIRDASLKVLWSELETLRPGDMVYRSSRLPPVFAVLDPDLVNAPDDEQARLKIKYGARGTRIADNTRQVSTQFVTSIRKVMIGLGYPVVASNQANAAKASGATHFIRTIVQPRYPEHKYTITTEVVAAESNQTVLQMRHDLRRDDVASWQP